VCVKVRCPSQLKLGPRKSRKTAKSVFFFIIIIFSLFGRRHQQRKTRPHSPEKGKRNERKKNPNWISFSPKLTQKRKEKERNFLFSLSFRCNYSNQCDFVFVLLFSVSPLFSVSSLSRFIFIRRWPRDRRHLARKTFYQGWFGNNEGSDYRKIYDWAFLPPNSPPKENQRKWKRKNNMSTQSIRIGNNSPVCDVTDRISSSLSDFHRFNMYVIFTEHSIAPGIHPTM
jgi:hypothetical protein